MKKHLWLFIALALCLAVPVAYAMEKSTGKQPAPKEDKIPPGVELSQKISMITGVAISPLLGVSSVGAWTYYHTPEDQRASLSWYAQPWFWASGLTLVLVVFLKDSAGTALPTALKKPLDAAEAVENKISGLVATGAFIPLVASVMHSLPAKTASLSAAGFATVDFTPLLNILTVPAAMVMFVIVWFVSHATHMLILISPFTTVDAALKAFRTFVLSTVVASSWINPYIGALWSIIIIVICYFLAGWAFRLTTFGTMYIWDFFTFGRLRFQPSKDGNKMFLACEYQKVPIRTLGKLRRDEKGKLVFDYRRLLIFPTRTLEMPEGRYAVGRGLFYPEVLIHNGEESKTLFVLPPRCKTHEEKLAAIYQFSGVEDVGLVKGLKAIWHFMKELFGFRESAPASA